MEDKYCTSVTILDTNFKHKMMKHFKYEDEVNKRERKVGRKKQKRKKESNGKKKT